MVQIFLLFFYLSPAFSTDTGFHMVIRLFWKTIILLVELYPALMTVSSQSCEHSVVVRKAVVSECLGLLGLHHMLTVGPRAACFNSSVPA